MPGGFDLDWKRKLSAPDRRQQFLARLDRTFSPAVLLGLEAIHVDRQLGWRNNICKIDKFPANKLGAIAKVEVFAERISLPASTLLDTGTPPETRGPIEIEKPAATAAGGLLKQKVPIQKNRLHSREQRIPTIQMPPAGLDHSDLRISKEMDCAL